MFNTLLFLMAKLIISLVVINQIYTTDETLRENKSTAAEMCNTS